jgi:hypothetical protein
MPPSLASPSRFGPIATTSPADLSLALSGTTAIYRRTGSAIQRAASNFSLPLDRNHQPHQS